MANHKSAEKRARQTVRRTQRNTALKSRVRGAIKAFRQALGGGDPATAVSAFETAARELRKAGSKGVLHKNAVSRGVARLAKAQNANKASAASST